MGKNFFASILVVHVETIESKDADGIAVFDYLQNYEDESLSEEEQEIINAWVTDNIIS